MHNLTHNSHTHCQAAQTSRTRQSLSKSVSEPTHGRKKSTIAQHCIRAIAGVVVNLRSVQLINFCGSGKVIALKSATALILDRCATFDQKTEMGNNIEKIFEILAEGGSIIGYRSFVGFEKDKRPNYLFNWTTNEIGLDDEGRFSSKSEMSKQNFSRFWKKIVQKYPLIYDLHPTFIPEYYLVKMEIND